MLSKLEKIIRELSLSIDQLKISQDVSTNLSQRDAMILCLLSEQGPMAVSEIAHGDIKVSFSTVSLNITKLWHNKLVSKTINPKNQRITIVELTEQGREIANILKTQRADRLKLLLQALKLTDHETEMLGNILTRAIPLFDNNKLNKNLVTTKF